MVDENSYLTVTDLNYYISQKFKNDPYLHKVFLQGELSNFRKRINSHQYFSLKDKKSKINIVMFKSFFNKLKFEPEEGMQVYITGYVSVYGPQGSYQFYAQDMEPAGLGALYEQLRQLQEKLNKEGLFDSSIKKNIPEFPDNIAVVTSASGAVIHDIMVTANRRFPHAGVDLFPAKVQGSDAADTIVAALKQIQALNDKYDVVIIGRGGGSLEDLWPFNQEEVVREIYKMAIPVISSVGHETDTTLSDLVADQRAATPTAAAEIATPNLVDILANINQTRARIYSAIQSNIHGKRNILKQIQNSIILREPSRLYDEQIQAVDILKNRLDQAQTNYFSQRNSEYILLKQKLFSVNPNRQLEETLKTSQYLNKNLKLAIKAILDNKRNSLIQLEQKLDDNSPLKTIGRGYVHISNLDNKTITSISELSVNENIKLSFKDGKAEAKLIKIEEEKNGNKEK